MTQIFAQGDLLIERVPDVFPSSGVVAPAADGAVVLAEGEFSGHRHAIHERVTFFRDEALARDMPAQLYVGHVYVPHGNGPAHLVHEEHDAIVLQEGSYRVRRQRQMEPSEVEIVQD